MIGGLTLFVQDVGNPANVAAGVAAAGAAANIAAHDHRRRRVRLRPSMRGIALLGLITIVCWVLIAAWGSAVSSFGFERFVPGDALLAWVLTSFALLGIGAGFQELRRCRTPLQ